MPNAAKRRKSERTANQKTQPRMDTNEHGLNLHSFALIRVHSRLKAFAGVRSRPVLIRGRKRDAPRVARLAKDLDGPILYSLS